MSPFDKIIGYESVKKELYQIIDMFKNKDIYEKMGAKMLKGVLLYGAPGLGKSMLAEALIEECNVKTYRLQRNKDDKECLEQIVNTFEEASKQEQAIILFDDLDKFSESDDDDVDDKMFVAIQTGIDSVKKGNVLVVATVNNMRKLPRSLIRPGRFDRKIALRIPTDADARKIIEYYLKQKNVSVDLDYDDVAKMISYTSCADLESIINESAVYAAYERKESIDMKDLVRAYLRDQYDEPDDYCVISQEEIDLTCLHEAGHAVASELIKSGSVGFVFVQTTGRSGVEGFTHLCDTINRRCEHAVVSLAGKAAVELFHQGHCASGCHDDLEKAFDAIRDGLSESGSMGIGMLDVANHRFPNTSENLNSRNEAVVQAELERYLFVVRDMLLKNKDFLLKVTEELKNKKYLLYSDMQAIKNSCTITPVTIIN